MNNIWHFIHGGGFVMYPLLLLSVGAVAVIIERLLAFRQLAAVPPGLLARVIELARASKYSEALAACRDERGPLAACLAVVLEHRRQPTREIERLEEETGQEYFIRMERLLPALDTTTTIAPLLGLLGTIVGMIGAFNAIASQQHGQNNDSVLSGVGEALYATATGLIVAVVCFAAYNYFAARLRTVTSETEQGATKLLNVLVERHHQQRGAHEMDDSPDTKAPRGMEENHGVQATIRA